MAEFSVVIRKKDEDSDSDVALSTRRRLIFYDDSSDDSAVKQKPTKPKRTVNKTKAKPTVSSQNKTSKPKEIKGLPKCPVCNDILEAKIKKVFSQPASTDVYFPFLSTGEYEPGEQPSKVKICYPCYEHLLYQWREYNMMEIPHKKRKYHDRKGLRIKSPMELKRDNHRKMVAEASEETEENNDKEEPDNKHETTGNKDVEENSEDRYRKLYENELKKREDDLIRREKEIRQREEDSRSNRNNSHRLSNSSSSIDLPLANTPSDNTPRDIMNSPKDKHNGELSSENQNGRLSHEKQDNRSTHDERRKNNSDYILQEIHSQLERVELNSNASLEIAKQEIENSIKVYTEKLKDEMYELKSENEAVRKQVMRMRKDISELRTEINPIVDDINTKKENKKNRNNEKKNVAFR